MPPREFTIHAAPPKPDDEQEYFAINVTSGDGSVLAKETFRILDYVPMAPFLVLNAALGGAGSFGLIRSNAALDQIVRSMLPPEDAGRWAAMIADPDLRIEAAQLQPIVEWLVEVVTGHPSTGPSDSSDGPTSSGASLTAAAPSTV